MRRASETKRIEQETKFFLCLLFAYTQDFEDRLLPNLIWVAAIKLSKSLADALLISKMFVSISSPSLSSLSFLSLLSYLSLSSCQLADGVAITDGVVLGGVHDHGALVGRIGRGMRHVLVARMYVQQALIYSLGQH